MRGRRRARVVVVLACVARVARARGVAASTARACVSPTVGFGPRRGRPTTCAATTTASDDASSPCAYFDALPGETTTRRGRGVEYDGEARHGVSGAACVTRDGRDGTGGERAACRNGARGRGTRYGPWCWTSETTWEYCDVPTCEADEDDGSLASYAFWDDLAALVEGKTTRSARSIFLESVEFPVKVTSSSSSSRDGGEVGDGSEHVESFVAVSSRLRSFVNAVAALTISRSCEIDVDHERHVLRWNPKKLLEKSVGTKLVKRSMKDVLRVDGSGFSQNVPRNVKAFIVARLPAALATDVVVPIADDGTEASSRLRESLVRCVVNAVPNRVVGIGANGLFLDLDTYEFTNVYNSQLTSAELAAFVETTIGWQMKDNYRRALCDRERRRRRRSRGSGASVTGTDEDENVDVEDDDSLPENQNTERMFKFVGDALGATPTRCAALDALRSGFPSATANSIEKSSSSSSSSSSGSGDSDSADASSSLLDLGEAPPSDSINDTSSFFIARRLSTLVPFSIFAGLIVLIILNAVRKFENFSDFDGLLRGVSDADIDDYVDDADSIGRTVSSGRNDGVTRYGVQTSVGDGVNGSRNTKVRYLILDVIARGANSVVYVASVQREGDDPDTIKMVALKEPHDRYKTKAEIAFLSSLPPSDYMCEFLGPVVEPRSRAWMVMFELCQHGSLRQSLIDRTYPRDGQSIHRAMSMIIKGLAHVHASNVVHRDVKMDNFLLWCPHCTDFRGSSMGTRCRRDHVVKISDLGLAKSQSMMFESSARLTGTLAYVAPERLAIAPTDITPEKYRMSDLYAIGLLFWELLYYAKFGQSRRVIEDVVPDEIERGSMSDAQIILMISTGRMKPSLDFVAPRIRGWLEKCIAFDPSARHQSLDEALRRLGMLGRHFHALLPEDNHRTEIDSNASDHSGSGMDEN
ncbi:Serine/threonine-protein kinase, active site [Ostreococcus tauri]|uniref:Serine/threonine-protein kinase, active site n=2 Tax=Ostreococcus tauri TaxID=70448 RepID=A0A096P8B7_OSTTA|nr:Serine/threonine-protein kinase, active site [Ostreococcus tauri]CEG00524.1 Serine/threonine-protein kinase, active site [Ostreococcus tauri]|eukprot:XP_003083822.2 Serine/threonine-protein kinase, active site [Ostreococcus tauri]